MMNKPGHKWGRMPEYLSPTAVHLFYDNLEEYYLKYLCADRPPRLPQTGPMSVGSAFDAYAKSWIFQKLNGHTNGGEFDFDTIFCKQVEEANRDFAKDAGKHCWEVYKFSGSLSDLMKALESSKVNPRFEFTVQGTVETERRGVPLLGKPDIFFVTKEDWKVVIDWKVNGFCSKSKVSPVKGFVMCRDGWEGKPSRTKNKWHKDCIPMQMGGIIVNSTQPLEQTDEKWALQIATYGWLLGVPVGSEEFIAGIDQLCCGAGNEQIRVAQHRARIGKDFQHEALDKYVHTWEVINSDHIFRDRSRDDSLALCEMLDKRAAALRGDGSEEDQAFSEMTR